MSQKHINENKCACNSHKPSDNNDSNEIKCCKCGSGACGDHGECGGGNLKKLYLYYIIGSALVLLAFLGELGQLTLWVSIPCAAAAYVVFGREVWLGAYSNIKVKKYFTEFSLMALATLGAIALGEFADAAAVMLLYSLGEAVSGAEYSRSRRNISQLIKISDEKVTVVKDGVARSISASEAKVGDIVSVRMGDCMALDGVVIDGNGFADTSAVTGESVPRELSVGEECLSGSSLISGAVLVRVTSEYEDSTATRLKKAVDIASKQKSPKEKKISRFAEKFTPVAFGVAVAVFVLGLFIKDSVGDALRSALVVLVASCPCSLVLSVPLAYFSAIGRAARRGIVFRGGRVVDGLSVLGTAVLDKTGTLTSSAPDFIGVRLSSDSPLTEKQLLEISKAALLKSPHASAKAFCEKYTLASRYKADDVKIIGGRGIVCRVGGKIAAFGNRKLMSELGVSVEPISQSAILVSVEGKYCGALVFSAKVKDNALGEVSALRGNGVGRVAIMSGDTANAVKSVADAIGVDEFYSELKPDEKLKLFDRIYTEEKKKNSDRTVAFCGDGLNDSAVIARADVGIAMGSGSALTVESADVVIVDDNLARINEAIYIAKDTVKIVEQNISISLGIKLAVVLLGLIAFPSLELAVIADVGAALITVINSGRAGK